MTTTTLPTDLIDASAAARLARCHVATIYRWTLKRRLRGWHRVGRLFVSRGEVVALFAPVDAGRAK